MPVDYDELKLRLRRAGPAAAPSYRVEAEAPDGTTASHDFALPFDEDELTAFVTTVGRKRRGVAASEATSHVDLDWNTAKEWGELLFEALFDDQGAVRNLYEQTHSTSVNREDGGLRITLYLDRVPELAGVPWEFLYKRGPGFLSQSIYTPIVRSMTLEHEHRRLAARPPLRILAVASVPRTREKLDVASEKRLMRAALRGLDAEITWLAKPTFSKLEEALSDRQEIHVFHFVGHGELGASEGILYFEDKAGEESPVTGEELGTLLHDHRIPLAVINACEGARSDARDPFSSVAASLLERGTAAVLAMQFQISDDAAIKFAERFYQLLVANYPIDAALARARMAIFAAGYGVEFATPVLFLAPGDTRLFRFEHGTGAEPPADASSGASTEVAEDTHTAPQQSRVVRPWTEIPFAPSLEPTLAPGDSTPPADVPPADLPVAPGIGQQILKGLGDLLSTTGKQSATRMRWDADDLLVFARTKDASFTGAIDARVSACLAALATRIEPKETLLDMTAGEWVLGTQVLVLTEKRLLAGSCLQWGDDDAAVDEYVYAKMSDIRVGSSAPSTWTQAVGALWRNYKGRPDSASGHAAATASIVFTHADVSRGFAVSSSESAERIVARLLALT